MAAVERGGCIDWTCERCKVERCENLSSFTQPNGESTRLSALMSAVDVTPIPASDLTVAESFMVDLPVTSHEPVEESSLNDPVVAWHPETSDDPGDSGSGTAFHIVSGGSKRGKDLLVEISGFSYNVVRR